jgi:hypothetical protein
LTPSDFLAIAALIISIAGLVLSLRLAKKSEKLAAAEKRTEAHTSLLAIQIEGDRLLRQLEALPGMFPKQRHHESGIQEMRERLTESLAKIPDRLKWIRDKKSNDPVQLEEYKQYVLGVESSTSSLKRIMDDLVVLMQREEQLGEDSQVVHPK